MSAQLYVLYVTVILAVIVPPGPSALLCMAHGAQHGAGRSGATVLGGICAALTLMLLSALGLGAAIAASDLVFQLIRWAGAAWLVYLGVTTWRAPAPTPMPLALAQPSAEMRLADPAQPKALRRLFATGWLVGVGNPKDLLFFGALFPQFLDLNRALAPQLAVMGLTWVVVEGLTMAAYAAIGARLVTGLGHGGGGHWFNRLTGAALVAVAVVLLASPAWAPRH